MTKDEMKAQLIENCDAFSEFTKNQIRQFLEIEMESEDCAVQTPQIEEDHDLFFSVLFSGSVYGEFIFGMNKKLALKLLDNEAREDGFDQMKDDIFDTFKEIINISAAQSLKQLDKKFDQLTITSPKITLGSFILPPLPLYCRKLHHKKNGHQSGSISCYLYIDTMRLNLAKSFDTQKEEIAEQEQKNQQLEKLNEAKSEFLANMSHELRTPLNGMIGTLEVIKQTELSSVQRNQLDVIEQSGDFLLGIINDILEFSKIESGKFTVETREFNLIESIEKTVKVIANQVYKKDLELFVDIQSGVPEVFPSDETRLKQLLINLIGNAIKFTPKGVIELIVSKKDSHLQFDVKDNGVGIPKNKLKTIFESFSQADVSDNRKYGGSGLGLTICQAIVSALEGQLSVESEEAVGTTFTFTIPIKNLQVVKDEQVKTYNHKALIVSKNDLLIKNTKTQFENLQIGTLKEIDSTQLIDHLKSEGNHLLSLLLDWKEWTSYENKGGLLKICQEKKIPISFLMKPDTALEISQYEDLLDGALGRTIFYPIVRNDIFRFLNQDDQFLFAKKIKPNDVKKVELSKCNRILLVEDNPVNQVVATAMLESLGMSIEIASNGQEALEKYQEEPFDLILMDCQMPVLNGFEAALKIRELEKSKERKTPIVALTASAFRETKERCYESGMDDFVTKPFKIETIQAAIKKNSG